MIGDRAHNPNNGAESLSIDKFHDENNRGGRKVGDANISRQAGIVAAREDNSRDLAVFRGYECMSRNHGR